MTLNTVVLIPLTPTTQRLHFGTWEDDNDQVKSQNKSKWQDLLLPWSQEILAFGNEAVIHSKKYAPRSLPSAGLVARCYEKPVFPMRSLDNEELEKEFGNVKNKALMLKELQKHSIANLPKLDPKHLKILIPSHGSPIGIGANESGPVRIPPEFFADIVYDLLICNRCTLESLAIRFLSCNSGTPCAGTEFAAYDKIVNKTKVETHSKIKTQKSKKNDQITTENDQITTENDQITTENDQITTEDKVIELVLKSFETSFAGRFAKALIQIISEEDKGLAEDCKRLKKMRISVSGIVGYYLHLTGYKVLVYEGKQGLGKNTPLENAIVTFTKAKGTNDFEIDCPKTLLRIAPTWLFPKDYWRAHENVMPESLMNFREHIGAEELLKEVVPEEEKEIWDLLTFESKE